MREVVDELLGAPREPAITPATARMLREGLRWKPARLAREVDVSIATVKKFEAGQPVTDRSREKILEALQQAQPRRAAVA